MSYLKSKPINMKTVFSLKYLCLLLCLPLLAVSCDDDNDPAPGNSDPSLGIMECAWAKDNTLKAKYQIVEYLFTAADNWTARLETSCDWCELMTVSGPAGASTLRLRVQQNVITKERAALISVAVEGYAKASKFIIRQEAGVKEQGGGKFRDVNQWMLDYMKTHYLWNHEVLNVPIDLTLDYQPFLTSLLDGVAKQNDANHDDGHWVQQKRMYYYTNVRSNAPTRAVGGAGQDAGFFLLQPTILGAGDDDPMGVAVMAVTPGTAAAKAGFKRGDFVSKINGEVLTQNNYKDMVNALYAGNVTATVNDVRWENQKPIITLRGDVEVGAEPYTDPAIYKSGIIDLNGKKVGYLLYMGFATAYDEELLELFKKFREEKVTELILDLRYNPGGEVLSSVVLNTLVAGAEYKGQVSTSIIFNEDRTQIGQGGSYKIGEAVNVERPDGYQPIATALNHALGLKTVYVIGTENTASASEMVINGLRGLDITVNLIGMRTNGKNVGMEGITQKFHGYDFWFYPITFYAENAKGFRDYSNGFQPDLELNDASTYPGDFGTAADLYSSAARKWIADGTKPAPTRAMQEGGQMRLIKDMWNESPAAQRMGGAIINLQEK